jgi:hypothetical protein
VLEAFRYIFGAIATTTDRHKEAVMDWARILACVTGRVDQELLARNGARPVAHDDAADFVIKGGDDLKTFPLPVTLSVRVIIGHGAASIGAPYSTVQVRRFSKFPNDRGTS